MTPLDGSELESINPNNYRNQFATLPRDLNLEISMFIFEVPAKRSFRRPHTSQFCVTGTGVLTWPHCMSLARQNPRLATGLALAHLPALIHVRLKESLELLSAFLEAQVALQLACHSMSKIWMKRDKFLRKIRVIRQESSSFCLLSLHSQGLARYMPLWQTPHLQSFRSCLKPQQVHSNQVLICADPVHTCPWSMLPSWWKKCRILFPWGKGQDCIKTRQPISTCIPSFEACKLCFLGWASFLKEGIV